MINSVADHYWLKTNKSEFGVGGAGRGVPGDNSPDSPGIPTEFNDHSGQSTEPGAMCKVVPNVDEECVNNIINSGRSTGQFIPFANDCRSVSYSVINFCTRAGQGSK